MKLAWYPEDAQDKDSLIIVGHATRGRKRHWSDEPLNGLDRESVPKSSEEQEVGMVGLRMQDMAGKVRRESRVGSKVKAAVGSKVAGEDSGGGV